MVKWLKVILGLMLIFLGVSGARAQEPTASPTPSATPATQVVYTVRVWWPDALYGADPAALRDQLAGIAADFNQSQAQYQVEIRLKRTEGSGSILSTLSAAQPVATSAIPDLVLLRREDLVAGVRGGLLRSVESWFPDALRADLLPNVLSLGQVDNMLYGIPYVLDLTHLAYRTANFEAVPTTFDAVLASGQRFYMAADPPASFEVNDVVLGQYLAAGGRLVDSAGLPTLDQEPLLDILSYYADGRGRGVFVNDLLLYSQTADYWPRFASGDVSLAAVKTSTYLRNSTLAGNVAFDSLPTSDGGTLVLIDGWMWALTATSPEQQMGALAFLEAIMDAEQQADYSQMLHVLPSRQRALRLWPNDAYLGLAQEWIRIGFIIPFEQRNNAAARQLQIAFEAVLNGASVEEAVNNALSFLLSG